MEPLVTTDLPTKFGAFQLMAFDSGKPDQPHLLLLSEMKADVPLVRIHSECWTGDVVGSLRCDCGDQLDASLKRVAERGGAIVYLRQEGRGIGLVEKMKAYNLQSEGMDTFEANEALGHQADDRRFDEAIAILLSIGFERIKLMTNNPEKLIALQQAGIEVLEVESIAVKITEENQSYLAAKKLKGGHGLLKP